MANLMACRRCGGLKRAESVRCPHCQVETSRGTRWLRRGLALMGLGALAACSSSPYTTLADAYGLPDTGPDGSQYFTPADAYGVVPFDAGSSDTDDGDAGSDGD
jgi:hypothetical protein